MTTTTMTKVATTKIDSVFLEIRFGYHKLIGRNAMDAWSSCSLSGLLDQRRNGLSQVAPIHRKDLLKFSCTKVTQTVYLNMC